MGLGRGAADRIDDGVDLIPFPQRVEGGEGHADLGPQGAEEELAAAGRADGLGEFEVLPGVDRSPVERLVVFEQVGEFCQVGCPRPEATLMVECTTGTSKVLMVLTVETAFLTRSA